MIAALSLSNDSRTTAGILLLTMSPLRLRRYYLDSGGDTDARVLGLRGRRRFLTAASPGGDSADACPASRPWPL